MDLDVLALVLLAAAAHAGWNAWLKGASPDLPGLATISVGWFVIGIISLPLVGLPSVATLPYLLATTVVHTLNAFVLVRAYRLGEFSLAYPVARGTGPLLVALLTPYLLAEYLEGPSMFAVTLIVTGILMIGVFRSNTGLQDVRVVLLSLTTGALIACYTIIDAEGARAGTSPHGYAAWLFLSTAAALIALAWVTRRQALIDTWKQRWRAALPMGVLSACAYWIVLWAMTVAPTALVAAVRETSILFAALIGWGLLGERVRVLRWVGVVMTVAGLVIAKL